MWSQISAVNLEDAHLIKLLAELAQLILSLEDLVLELYERSKEPL